MLTLRYQMETQSLDEGGNQVLHRIVDDVELPMEHNGFKYGVDGIHASQLFGDPRQRNAYLYKAAVKIGK